MSFTRIGILGAGSWGTALAILLGEKGLKVTLWGHDPAHVEAIKKDGSNERYLPSVPLPPQIVPTARMSDLVGCDLVLFVTPSKAIREVAQEYAALGPGRDVVLLSCTKGIEQRSGLRMSQVLAEVLPGNRVAVLSGPSHAEEVARKVPAAVVIGCAQEPVAAELQQLFSTSCFRPYRSTDVAGIELGGALKNIFAIAAGISDGLGMGDNTKAALVTRALAELIRLGTALGGRREVFQGLGGVGDLMVTCYSRHSRNRSVGERLGHGEPPEAISASMTMVAEGVPTTRSAYECARKLNVDTPIIDQIYAILFEGKSPRNAMVELLNREPRAEQE